MSIARADLELVPQLRAPESAEAILANVQDILPVVREEAESTSDSGALTDRMCEALRRAGVFRVAFPRHRGGPELSLTDQTRIVEMVSTVDASIAWNATVLAAAGFYAGRISDVASKELYPELDLPTCGSFHPKGRADVVDGGYRVTGRWNFGSGIRSASRIVAGAEVFDAGEPVRKPDGTHLTLGVWLPVDQVKILDDWKVVGLRGTSSNGYAVDGAFVPKAHAFDRFAAPNADNDPLNKNVELLFYSMSGISVGVAQHALDLAVDHLARRPHPAGERELNLLGEATTMVRAARTLVFDGISAIDQVIFTPGALPEPEVMACGDAPLATQFARIVLDRVADILGSRVIYNSHPYARLQGDLVGIAAHISTARSRWTDVGRTAMGSR